MLISYPFALEVGAYTKEEFAQLIGVSCRTVERLTTQNKIKPIVTHKRSIRYGYTQIRQFYCLTSQNISDFPKIYRMEEFAEEVRLSPATLKKMDKNGTFPAFKDVRGGRYYTQDSFNKFYDFAAQRIPLGSEVCSHQEAANILRVTQKTLQNWLNAGEIEIYTDICLRKYYLKVDIVELARTYVPENWSSPAC